MQERNISLGHCLPAIKRWEDTFLQTQVELPTQAIISHKKYQTKQNQCSSTSIKDQNTHCLAWCKKKNAERNAVLALNGNELYNTSSPSSVLTVFFKVLWSITIQKASKSSYILCHLGHCCCCCCCCSELWQIFMKQQVNVQQMQCL